MKIAFDAKRAYHNNTGLGNYSRTLITDLAHYFPDNELFLFNPKKSGRYVFKEKNIVEILPSGFLSRAVPSLWRSKWIISDLLKLDIELYHGLSHEIPVGIQDTTVKSIVTIHDLIFERYPQQYNPLDVKIYRKKFRHACKHADRIIAISEQTKRDIIDFYHISGDKIDVCYQSCDESFHPGITEMQKSQVSSKFALPGAFFLSVGSIIERKNLLNICKAMLMIDSPQAIPLVVIGKGEAKYKSKVDNFILQHGLTDKVIFLDHVPMADLPVIYSLSSGLIYPSFFEGFGIPVLEALSVGVPVITSSASCLPEAGGNAALYADPDQPEELAACMLKILTDEDYVNEMVKSGFLHAEKFSNKNCAVKVMEAYGRVIPPVQTTGGIR